MSCSYGGSVAAKRMPEFYGYFGAKHQVNQLGLLRACYTCDTFIVRKYWATLLHGKPIHFNTSLVTAAIYHNSKGKWCGSSGWCWHLCVFVRVHTLEIVLYAHTRKYMVSSDNPCSSRESTHRNKYLLLRKAQSYVVDDIRYGSLSATWTTGIMSFVVE